MAEIKWKCNEFFVFSVSTTETIVMQWNYKFITIVKSRNRRHGWRIYYYFSSVEFWKPAVRFGMLRVLWKGFNSQHLLATARLSFHSWIFQRSIDNSNVKLAPHLWPEVKCIFGSHKWKRRKKFTFYAQLNQNDSEWNYHIAALDLSLSTCEKRWTMCKRSTENFIKWTREKPDATLDQHQQRVCCARLGFCLSAQSQSNSFSSTFCIKYHFPLLYTSLAAMHIMCKFALESPKPVHASEKISPLANFTIFHFTKLQQTQRAASNAAWMTSTGQNCARNVFKILLHSATTERQQRN